MVGSGESGHCSSPNSKLPISLQDLIQLSTSPKSSHACNYLSKECYFIIECRVCCNLFRTVNAFLSHKEKICLKSSTVTSNADAAKSNNELTSSPNGSASIDTSNVCEFCGKVFENQAMKSRHEEYFHMSSISPVKPYIPQSKISQSVNANQDLRSKLLSSKEQPAPVSDVPSSGTSLSNGVTTCPSEGMQCQQCTKWFPTSESLKTHLNTNCPNMNILNPKKPPMSIIGGSTSLDSKSIPKVRHNSLKCDFCIKEFKLERTKEKHMEIYHSSELKTSLSTTVRSVNSVFSCNQCHRMYSDENSLKRHVVSVHEADNDQVPDARQAINRKRSSHWEENNENTNSNNSGAKTHHSSKTTLSNDSTGKNVSKTTTTALGDETTGLSSIYCDVINMQCLICLSKLPSLEELRNHFKTEHHFSPSSVPSSAVNNGVSNGFNNSPDCLGMNDSEGSPPPPQFSGLENIEGISQQVFLERRDEKEQTSTDLDQLPWLTDIDMNDDEITKSHTSSNLECMICGRKFLKLADYDYHMTLPHKISITKQTTNS